MFNTKLQHHFILNLSWWLVALTLNPLIGQVVPDGFTEQIITNKLQFPVGITFDDAGIGYIWEQEGRVKLLDTNDLILADPFLDLSAQVSKWNDQGMLGFTLHPEFPTVPFVYAMYVVDMHHYEFYGSPQYDPNVNFRSDATFGRISRFTADETNNFRSVLINSEKVLIGKEPLDGFPILFDSHGVGSLVFGNDGSLLASCGDGASSIVIDTGSAWSTFYENGLEKNIIRAQDNVGAFRAQMLNNLSGKIIRIDPDNGDGLEDNPFAFPEALDKNRSKIWSMGLRNPYRMVVKPGTGGHGNPGDIYIGDVGYFKWEEINIASKGGENFGWPIYEGPYLSDYAEFKVQNKDASNALSCSDFFTFDELLAVDNEAQNKAVYNPCDSNKIIEAKTYIHKRPFIAYRNVTKDSIPVTLQSSYDDLGKGIVNNYEDAIEGTASIGGLFYQGDLLPGEFHKKYFHIDFDGWIKVLDFNLDGSLKEIIPIYDNGSKFVHIQEKRTEGSLYFLTNGGSLIKIGFGGNIPPVIHIDHSSLVGPSPLEVNLDASATKDEHGPLSFNWFIDGELMATESQVNFTMTASNAEPTNKHITLVVSDTLGATSEQRLTAFLNNNRPDVKIQWPVDGGWYPIDKTNISFMEGLATDPESSNEELDFVWSTFLHHEDHFHDDLTFYEERPYLIPSNFPCEGDQYHYRIKLEVFDEQGLSNVDEIEIFPNCNPSEYVQSTLTSLADEHSVNLELSLDQPENVNYAIIQRGITERDFYTLDTIRDIHITSFSDLMPPVGELSYRLKFIGTNNDWYYSNISKVHFPVKYSHQISPNPSDGLVRIEVEKVFGEKIYFQLVEPTGRNVFEKEYEGISDQAFEMEGIRLKLAPGTYIYKISDAKFNHTGKLVIVE